MTVSPQTLLAFLGAHGGLALIEVVAARGSTPREAGTWMLVAGDATLGTIGGGQLEFMAIDHARRLLAAPPAEADRLSVPLGPEIGQCCGGRVDLAIRPLDGALRAELVGRARAAHAARPSVLVFGGGHVGKALAEALSLLPLAVTIVETRDDALDGMPQAVETRLTAMPEEAVRAAPAGAAYVVLTHDHALDFLIVAEALARTDTAYVGMIGSRTKKATFRNWYLKTGGGSEAALARLVSPIGGDGVRDKRPEVIAALAAAEIMTALVRAAAAAPAAGHAPAPA